MFELVDANNFSLVPYIGTTSEDVTTGNKEEVVVTVVEVVAEAATAVVVTAEAATAEAATAVVAMVVVATVVVAMVEEALEISEEHGNSVIFS